MPTLLVVRALSAVSLPRETKFLWTVFIITYLDSQNKLCEKPISAIVYEKVRKMLQFFDGKWSNVLSSASVEEQAVSASKHFNLDLGA